MQIELAPELEAKLTQEAGELGVSPVQLSAEILSNHFAASRSAAPEWSPLSPDERKKLFEDHIAWLEQSSPGWETRDPYAVDWQAIKSEGRKH